MTLLHPGSDEQIHSLAITIQKSISCKPLPQETSRLQRASLWRLHSACGQKMKAAHILRFCCVCAINEKGFNTKMRLCCQSGNLSCTSCPDGTILSVDMLGVVLTVCNTPYYLCPCCIKVCVWNSDGHDLCPEMHHNTDSVPDHSTYRIEDACTCSLNHAPLMEELPPRCVVCSGKHIGRHIVTVPDHTKKTMVVSHFCSRHMPPPHVIACVHDMASLKSAVRQRL